MHRADYDSVDASYTHSILIFKVNLWKTPASRNFNKTPSGRQKSEETKCDPSGAAFSLFILLPLPAGIKNVQIIACS